MSNATQSNSKHDPQPNKTYTFKIKDVAAFKSAKNTTEFKSPFFELHGFKWCLRIFPNGSTKAKKGNVNYFLWLRSLPPKFSKISVNITLSLRELDINAAFPHQFTDKAVTRGWTTGTLKTSDIQHLESLTFAVDITLHDIYGAAGNLLSADDDEKATATPQLSKQSSELIIDQQTLQESRLETLTLRLEELMIKFDSMQSAIDVLSDKQEESDAALNAIVNEFAAMKKGFNDEQKEEAIVVTKENTEVFNFLEKDCNLRTYFELFVRNGVDNMSICKLLNMEHLEKMGVTKLGHRINIAHKIAVLNQKQSST